MSADQLAVPGPKHRLGTVRGAVLPDAREEPRSDSSTPDPTPDEGEALVDVSIAALNRADLLLAKGANPGGTPLLPSTSGQEAVRRVRAVGAGSDPDQIGKRVWVRHPAAVAPRRSACHRLISFACSPSS